MDNLKLYTVGQASNMLGVSRVTIHKWIKDGVITPIPIQGVDNYFTYAISAQEVEKKIAEEKAIVQGAIIGTYKQYGTVLEKLADA